MSNPLAAKEKETEFPEIFGAYFKYPASIL